MIEEGGSRAHGVSELCHLFPSLLYAWWFGGWGFGLLLLNGGRWRGQRCAAWRIKEFFHL